MELKEAIATLRELVGCETLLKFDRLGAVRVIAIDFDSDSAGRCILARVEDQSLEGPIRRRVSDITLENRFHDAAQAIDAAGLADIRVCVENAY